MFRKIASFFSVLVMAVFMLFVATAPASGHTPGITATCEGVKLHATNYDGNAANTWTVSLDGVVTSGTFGAFLDKVIPVPQDGKTTTVGAQISDVNQTPEYSEAFSGAVGPCGTKPPVVEEPPVVVIPEKPAPIVTVNTEEDKNCEIQRINFYVTTTTIDWVLENNVWVQTAPVETYEQFTREVTPEECPTAVTPTPETPVSNPETPVTTPEKPSDSPTPQVGTEVPPTAVVPAGAPTATLVADQPTKVTPVANVGTLASTGFDGVVLFWIGGAAVVLGLALIALRKIRKNDELFAVSETTDEK
jgi:LPXTG-motif cell wall-anchored protein